LSRFGTLAHIPLLEGLQPDELTALEPHIEHRQYTKGETLFLKGDPGGALMIVKGGSVELFLYDEEGNRLVLNVVTTGGFFGEVTLFDKEPRTTNAMATEDTDVLVIRQETMVAFIHKHPDAAIHMINVLSKRLRDNTNILVSGKDRKAYDLLQEQRSSRWDRIADVAANLVGSWRYLMLIFLLVISWVMLNLTQLIGTWDRPIEFNVLNLTLTIVGALQVPLILMSQRRQDDYSRIAADLEYQVNLKAQLAILEVTRKLDWLREAFVDQAERLQRLEDDHRQPDEATTTEG
jgi:CRP/FNR family transcriptional regulator, cyclic AMP receptor protein